MDRSFYQDQEPQIEQESISWIDVWGNAITSPSVTTYQEIVQDSNGSNFRSYLWVGLSSLFATILTVLLQQLIGHVSGGDLSGALPDIPIPGLVEGALFLSLLCLIPVSIILSILGFITYTGMQNIIAKVLGGEGSFRELAIAISAYYAPLTVFGSIISAIPFINILSLPLSLYTIFLNIVAIKSVHQLSWGRSLITSVFIPLVFGILIIILVVVVLSLIGVPLTLEAFRNFREFQRMPR